MHSSEMDGNKTPDYKKGYDAAVNHILAFIKKQKRLYVEQFSRTESLICGLLVRDITELFQCYMDTQDQPCPKCKLPNPKNYHYDECYHCHIKANNDE